jgi:hypothetical protein
MSNEHDDDKRSPSERIKDGSHPILCEVRESIAKKKEDDERRQQRLVLPPAKVTLSPEQIETIAEAVANKVIAALKAEGA